MITSVLRGVWKPILVAVTLAVFLSGCHYYHRAHRPYGYHNYYAPPPPPPRPAPRPYYPPYGYYY